VDFTLPHGNYKHYEQYQHPKSCGYVENSEVSHIPTATTATTNHAYAHKDEEEKEEEEDISNGLNQRTFLSGLDIKKWFL
jgi:hypothetical protein